MRANSIPDVPERSSLIDFWFSIQSVLSLLCGRESSPRNEIRQLPYVTGGSSFCLIEHTGADRCLAEQFISKCFAEKFGARVEAFMPRLFSLRDHAGAICGAFGLRSANHRLFVEHYLDRPIEQLIAERTSNVVERRAIVEIGHFSGAFPGAMRTMICLLTEHLQREGFRWVVFTGTASLRNAFYRVGLFPIEIQAAAIERIPEDIRAQWGSYYDHFPRVLMGNIDQGFRTLVQGKPPALPTSRGGA